MNILSLSGAALCVLVMILTTKEIRREGAVLLTLSVGVLAFTLLLPHLEETVGFIHTLSAPYGLTDHAAVLLKGLGISYITAVTKEICRSSGEGTLAGYVETVGKAELVLLSLPLLRELTETAFRYI